jgi:hypothetical protein
MVLYYLYNTKIDFEMEIKIIFNFLHYYIFFLERDDFREEDR